MKNVQIVSKRCFHRCSIWADARESIYNGGNVMMADHTILQDMILSTTVLGGWLHETPLDMSHPMEGRVAYIKRAMEGRIAYIKRAMVCSGPNYKNF